MKHRNKGFLDGARVYLSGPMDFVNSRSMEKKTGWRNKVGDFLKSLGVTVFDPWNKPGVRGYNEYGNEDDNTTDSRNRWTFEDTPKGAEIRSKCSKAFWETMHIDLRMVDTSDFIISYCPTNVYSVGTVHEIILCRQQKKPLLFVSPKVEIPSLNILREYLSKDQKGNKYLNDLEAEIPIKNNEKGIPSLWYMSLINSESFFDGFGFREYCDEFNWDYSLLDINETRGEFKRPLLPYLKKINKKNPTKWDDENRKYINDDDWLLWDINEEENYGKEVNAPYKKY